MNGVKSEKFWTTSIVVEAFKLNAENIKRVSNYLGGDYIEAPGRKNHSHDGGNEEYAKQTHFHYGLNEVYIGEWVVKYSDGRCSFFTEEEFKKFFYSHGERLAKDEKYAAVYLRVKAAMTKQDVATYHDKGSSDEMDLVAIETTKELLKIL